MLEKLIESSKESYYKRVSQKLSLVSTSSKCYISLFMKINDPDATAEQLCEDLDKINE